MDWNVIRTCSCSCMTFRRNQTSSNPGRPPVILRRLSPQLRKAFCLCCRVALQGSFNCQVQLFREYVVSSLDCNLQHNRIRALRYLSQGHEPLGQTFRRTTCTSSTWTIGLHKLHNNNDRRRTLMFTLCY